MRAAILALFLAASVAEGNFLGGTPAKVVKADEKKTLAVAAKTAAKTAAVAATLAAPKPAAKVEVKPAVVKAVAKAVEAKEARKVAVKPVEAAPKPVAKVVAKPVVAKATDKVSPHIVPVPAKTAAKLPAPVGHPEGPQSKVAPKPVAAVAKPVVKAAAVVAKPAAKAAPKVEVAAVKAVPHAAVVVAVSHKAKPAADAKAKPAADASKTKLGDKGKGAGVPKPMTIHDHATAAQKSADEATQHLAAAKAAYAKTKSNVQDVLKTGKKIESTAGKIDKLYTPPKKVPKPVEAAAFPSSLPAILALFLAAALNC